jgi:hypothetical protein
MYIDFSDLTEEVAIILADEFGGVERLLSDLDNEPADKNYFVAERIVEAVQEYFDEEYFEE